MEYRSAEQVAVDGRVIELIVMPHEQEALVHHDGRMIREICTRGAFAGSEDRANRVRVNRDHNVERTVGQAVSIDPYDPEGVIAHIRIAKTALGDETLALASEGILDASAGFLPTGETWEGRSRRRITEAWLGHIAMTPDPAYEGANVIAGPAGSRFSGAHARQQSDRGLTQTALLPRTRYPAGLARTG